MEEMYNLIMIISPIFTILEVAAVAFTILYMHFTAKRKNYNLGAGWYICAVFFTMITLIVFLVKKKNFSGPEIRICANCGCSFPVDFNVCTNCGMELPLPDESEKDKYRKYSKGFGIALIVIYVISALMGPVIAALTVKSVLGDYDSWVDINYRISVDDVYYDKLGNAYDDEDDVLLYDEQGNVYAFVEAELYDEDYDYTYVEEYYVRSDGQKYFAYDCYVTDEGWFYCDKGGLLEYYTVDTSAMTPEELDAYYEERLNEQDKEYKYYDRPYVDADGNLYYSVHEASWNANGELITAANDFQLKDI